MRLTSEEIEAIKSSIYRFDPKAKIYLFGSRADPNKRGGDIDLLIFSDSLTDFDKVKIEMALFEKIEATQNSPCARCGKPLKIPMEIGISDWLFHEETPPVYDDTDELLRIDLHKMEIDLREPIRQELLLHFVSHPRCNKLCLVLAEVEPQPNMPLSGLRELAKKPKK